MYFTCPLCYYGVQVDPADLNVPHKDPTLHVCRLSLEGTDGRITIREASLAKAIMDGLKSGSF